MTENNYKDGHQVMAIAHTAFGTIYNTMIQNKLNLFKTVKINK